MSIPRRTITEDMLANLPAPVQRYMHYTGVVGKPWIETVRLYQSGRFRRGVDQPWMGMSAMQEYTTDPPGFVWKARFKMWGLPLFRARDSYQEGHGRMFGKTAGLFTLFDARGEGFDQAALVRYLSEVIWFPTAFLGENFVWQGLDEGSAQVTITDSGRSVSGTMFFDGEGRPTRFIAPRYNSDLNRIVPWETPIDQHASLNGLNIPTRGRVSWKLADGDLTYWDGSITQIEYNKPVELFDAAL